MLTALLALLSTRWRHHLWHATGTYDGVHAWCPVWLCPCDLGDDE